MDERLRFVARLLEGEKMAALCREFDLSRKTGYKLFERYKNCGIDGLNDRSRRPHRHANQLPFQIETLIVQLKRAHPSWVRPRSARRSADCIAMFSYLRSAPCMRCWTGAAWLPEAGVVAIDRKARACPHRPNPTICGAPITKASSCSLIGAIAIH